jgi:hypothetical protein
MILDKKVIVGLCGRNINYYEKLGYKIPRKKDKKGRINFTKGTKIEVDIKDLMPTSKVKVLCKCDECGKERKVYYDTIAYRKNSQFLITGKTLCIQCSNTKLFKGVNNPNYIHGNNRFCEYRLNAKKRNISFNLTIQQFEALTEQKCFYCGGYSKDQDKRSRGNGIDRKDNDKGYNYDNCLPCCRFCNFVKNKLNYKEFLKHIRKIYNNTLKYEI